MTFLDLYINSLTMSLSLPEKKILDIQNKCQNIHSSFISSFPKWQVSLGNLEAARPAIWQAPLHYRYLQIQLIKSPQASQHNYEACMSLNSNAQAERHWRYQNVPTVNGSPINPPAPDLYITSDASKAGSGACCQGSTANGGWSRLEAKQHI